MCAARRREGLTLIELIVALAIVAIVASLALPSMRVFMMQQRLKSTASELLTDIQMARGAALSQSEGLVTVTFGSNGTVTCYAVVPKTDLLSSCDCTGGGSDVCSDVMGNALPTSKVVSINRSSSIAVTSGATIYFRAFNGMMSDLVPKSVTVVANPGGQLQVVISKTGLPSICVPSGSNVSGFPPCN